MLILILIDVQYSQKAVFSFEKGSNRQNHSCSGSLSPVTPPPPSKISDSPATSPHTAIWKTLLIAFCNLGNKICKFYHVLLVNYNHSNWFQKLSLKYFVKFQETKYDGLQSFILSKNVVLQLYCIALLLQV